METGENLASEVNTDLQDQMVCQGCLESRDLWDQRVRMVKWEDKETLVFQDPRVRLVGSSAGGTGEEEEGGATNMTILKSC